MLLCESTVVTYIYIAITVKEILRVLFQTICTTCTHAYSALTIIMIENKLYHYNVRNTYYLVKSLIFAKYEDISLTTCGDP